MYSLEPMSDMSDLNFSHAPTIDSYYADTRIHMGSPSTAFENNAGTGTSRRPSKLSLQNIKEYWAADLRIDTLMEVQLLLLTFAIGIQDAISYPDFRCFASNQTGNTVVLAVALAGNAGALFDPKNTGVSLGAFLAGAIATGHLGTLAGRRRRAWQIWIAVLQTLMAAGSAWIQYVHGVEQTGAWARVSLALLACASGSQVAGARAMRVPEIPTAMATAAWIDLLIDENLLSKHNKPRNRRVLFLGTLIAGSFAGAFAHRRIGSPAAILVSVAVKTTAVVAMLFSPADPNVTGAKPL